MVLTAFKKPVLLFKKLRGNLRPVKIYYTKEISSAHRLSLPYESKCLRLHGHNYKVELFIEGEKNEVGMIVDFTHLKGVVMSYDHIFMNDIVEQPTVENILSHMLGKLMNLPHTNISSITVRIWEDSESYAEDTWLNS